MKRTLFALAAVMLMTVCFSSETMAQKFSKVVTDPERWTPISFEAPEECSGDPEKCALEALGALKINVGDEPEFSVYGLGEVKGTDVTVVFVSYLPEENDFVLGELYRLELSGSGAADSPYRLNALGRMYQCTEGPAGWQKTECS